MSETKRNNTGLQYGQFVRS